MSKTAGKHSAAKPRKLRDVKGLLDPQTGEFLPYPLPLSYVEINDEEYCDLSIALRNNRGDGGRPYRLEFRVDLYLTGLAEENDLDDPSALLDRTAQRLNVDPVDLPKLAVRTTSEEDEARTEVLIALRNYLLLVIARWAGLREVIRQGDAEALRKEAYPNGFLQLLSGK